MSAAPGGDPHGELGRHAVQVSVVVATRNRRESLLRTLDRLAELSENPPVIVVDNGSTDGTPEAVRDEHPDVRLIPLARNLGAAARNLGVGVATTPFVAFSDDDSWWAPGALARAGAHLAARPDLALVAARILVGPEQRLDPVSRAMGEAATPSGWNGPGPPVLGFLACGAVARRDAFLEVGGFDELLFFLGEEQLVALDLEMAGWRLAYADDVVAHHHPSPGPASARRRRLQLRNHLLSVWLRRSPRSVIRETIGVLGRGLRDPQALLAVAAAGVRLPSVLTRRRVIHPDLERRLELLER